MAVTLENNARNAACDAIVDLLDGGTIEIQGADNTVLAVLTFGTPAFGAASNGVATAEAITQDSSADATGTAAKFVCKASGGTAVFSGTVTASGGGGDMELVTTSITATQPVQITSFTFTIPAS
jgi:hypothetical protein